MLKDELDAYLDDISQNLTAVTVASHRSTLTQLVNECQNHSITVDELSAQWVAEYLTETSANHSNATIRGKVCTIANFLAYIQSEDPDLIGWRIRTNLNLQEGYSTGEQESTSEGSNKNEYLKTAVGTCLDHARDRAYGTRVHAVTEILAATGCRLRAVQELNLEDFHLDACEIEVSISKRHAVGQTDSEVSRTVALSIESVSAVQTYIEYERIPIDNTTGAEPLFTTINGRLSAATLRRSMKSMISDAFSDSTIDESDSAVTQGDGEEDQPLSPRHIRWYYIAQLTEE